MRNILTKFALTATLGLAITFTLSCSSDNGDNGDEGGINFNYGSVTDNGGRTYKTVQIGEQTWMAENLNYDAEGSKCNNDYPANCEKYGRLYTWSTAQSACPSGWHLPSDAEWTALTDYVGGETIAGEKLKAKSGWDNNNNGNGTDEFGFSALPGGGGGSNGSFGYVGTLGYWWSSTEYSAALAWGRRMAYGGAVVERSNYGKANLYSVRCVQDPDVIGGTFIDSRDDKTYKYATIGTQTWMAENLNYNASGSECYSNSDANCTKYGRLYDWATAKTVCPSGWHLPSDAEWTALTDYVGSNAGTKLKAKSGWNDNYNGSSGSGTDAHGFSALPGGYNSGANFDTVGGYGGWWSATENGASYAWNRYMYYFDASVNRDGGGKTDLFSVRCLQD
jgi:uncharacterized protein (TIGR02145 family)